MSTVPQYYGKLFLVSLFVTITGMLVGGFSGIPIVSLIFPNPLHPAHVLDTTGSNGRGNSGAFLSLGFGDVQQAIIDIYMLSFNDYCESNEIRGEYWIIDGNVVDGDIGDLNHEAIALDSIRRSIIDKYSHEKYGKFVRDYVDWDEFLQAIIEEERQFFPQLKDNELIKKSLQKHYIKNDLWKAANEQTDAREYVIEHFGWKAVGGDNIETWNLTAEDMKEIADGLGEIEELDDDYVVSVYVYAQNKSYDFTIKQLEDGQLPKQNIDIGNVAKQQVKDIETSKLHPYYKQRSFPFGDSVISFRNFISE